MNVIPGLGRILPFKALSVALVISLLASTSFAQQAKVLAPHEPIAPRVPKSQELPLPPAKVGSVVGGPWMVDANFKSAIYIKNVVEVYAVTVTPILYLSNGTRYKLPDVKLDPAGTAIVDVNAALDSLGLASYATLSGYVEIQYNFPWLPICAFIRNVDTAHSMIFLQGLQALPTELLAGASAQAAMKQQVLEGMWWKQESSVTGFVTLSNTSGRPIAATIETSNDSGKTFATHNVTVSANGTKIINMQELLSTQQAKGGIRVAYTGPQNALMVNGGLEDASVGYSANLHFLATQPAAKVTSASAVELGLMVGAADPMMSFPAGTNFTPYSLLRNTSNLPAVVTPTLWWMQGGMARSFALPAISLQPLQTRELDLISTLFAAGLKNFSGSFNLSFDIKGVLSGILTASGSVDQTKTYVFEVNTRGIGVSAGRSLPYWSTGNGDNTMVTLWNPADESQDFVFKFSFSGGHYVLPIHLESRATRSFNVAEIIQSQVPDAEGNIIPAGIHEGSAKIMGSLADNQQILFAAEIGIYNVRKATCGAPSCQTCDGATATAVAANPFGVPVGGQTQLNLMLTWSTGSQYNYTNSSNWSSNNTGVATVQTGLTHGVSAGSATVSAQATSPVQEYVQNMCSETGVVNCPSGNNGASSTGNACPTPSSETTRVAGQDSTLPAETDFAMTLSNTSGGSFDGQTVQEQSGGSGTDTCYWAGNAIGLVQSPTISGGTWTVAGGDVNGQHNQWGYDTIGYHSTTAPAYIRANGPAHGVSIPCTQTIHQSMIILCSANNIGNYTSDTITIKVNAATSVTNCRAGVCQTISGY